VWRVRAFLGACMRYRSGIDREIDYHAIVSVIQGR